MSTNITIDKNKTNEFEFELDVQGAEAKSLVVRLILNCENMIVGFPCVKLEDGAWNVKIPPIANFGINPKSYLIEGVMEGHYFNILNGTVECTESEAPAKIAASEPKKVGHETEKENNVIPPQDDYSFTLGKKEDNEKPAEDKKEEKKPEVGIKTEPKRIKTESKNLDDIVSKILTETASKTPKTISTEKDSIVKQLLSESKKKSGARFKKGDVVTK